ncbi:ArpU family phage packaging/lysis transcriptional regulator [Lactobacillus paragasseri]|uniref:ArpU family phage packaging/lysis transcriptional regulator n=1 Tax=Lactobacillus paragasseri TaxID=2107999 RepID=UPI00217DFCC8|nr:ArpU family phage packaging/lysis transcriptional regulator [Lactobacillus paragasseri]UWI43866.1 ArpU family transcriptional regulator [Lactobacillus paragasseri]UWI45110.1 ArpU family transcriptional regulator [Lactobacillus paragasseri]
MLEINEPVTIKNTEKFFEKDLERYQTMCAGRYDVHSVNFDNIKVNSSPKTGAIMSRYSLIIAYNDRLACLKPAIDNCTNEPNKPYKRIIELRYLNQLASWDIANRLGYGHTQFNVLRKRALLQFADVYLMEQLKQGVKDILDLHAYKEAT